MPSKNRLCTKDTKGWVSRPQPHYSCPLAWKSHCPLTPMGLILIQSKFLQHLQYYKLKAARFQQVQITVAARRTAWLPWYALEGDCAPSIVLTARWDTNLSCYDALIFLFWYDVHRLVLCVLWSGIYWIWPFSFRSVTTEDKDRQHRWDGCCLTLPLRHAHPSE